MPTLASKTQQNDSREIAIATTINTIEYAPKVSSDLVFNKISLRSNALKFAQQGQYSEAIALLNKLIDRSFNNAIDYNNRGLIYFKSGEKQKAFCDYNTALKLNPKLVAAYNNRANYYVCCGDLAAAIADYDRAIDLNPSYVRARINRGITLRDLGQYKEAIENFEIALLFGQLEAYIWAECGRTYYLWGDCNCALTAYNRAFTLLSRIDPKKEVFSYRLYLQLESWLNELSYKFGIRN
ncbi:MULTISPECIES: tetratricopeptide repeat protein [unclassified Nostoc]|uniref:tetratricopeptide repeat protein n=1 Tax=unclassified Nostoc TaxID=2593658 RepID=UPI002AD2BC3B|nr:tetratricopeptide repeat protein [Nostoc sp. DedQUE03]MDZ7972554.1 tetratricopeptide repeat protein [Nostoc sp. DedQUE03]MDZ8048457.1 tetratricopeptide repeat protein [Nostoc sp. DedQUE02]